MTTIQVFHNTSRDGMGFGFRNDYSPSSVRRVARFELSGTITSQLSAGVPVFALDTVYEQLNIGAVLIPAEPWTVQYRNDGNRSLSTGDVVVVGEVAYAVASFGWQQITTDELLDAINLERVNA